MIKKTNFKNLFLIKNQTFKDPRGYFNLALHHLSRTFIPVNNEQDTNQNENKKKEITVRIDEENFRKSWI